MGAFTLLPDIFALNEKRRMKIRLFRNKGGIYINLKNVPLQKERKKGDNKGVYLTTLIAAFHFSLLSSLFAMGFSHLLLFTCKL